MKKRKLNSIHAGTLIDADRCVVAISDKNEVESIGLTPHDVNNATDYAIYRLIGPKWMEDDQTPVVIKSLISDHKIEVTGREFDQWYNKKEEEENQKIRSFFNSLSKEYKSQQQKS